MAVRVCPLSKPLRPLDVVDHRTKSGDDEVGTKAWMAELTPDKDEVLDAGE